MEISAAVVTLKPGMRKRVRAWAETINSRREEALQTLEDEGVASESWFLFSLDEQDFLICYMSAESLDKAQEAVKQSVHSIDAYHKRFKEDTWDTGLLAELLVHLEPV